MLKQKDDAVKGLTSGIEHLFKKYKVTYEKGIGKIVGPNEVSVTPASGSPKSIKTQNILIATGSDVTSLPGIQIDEKTIVSSTGALSLQSVPEKLVVIGGGVIGLELGSVWRRLGSQVTVVEYLGHICSGADAEIATKFKSLLEAQKMKFLMNTKVVSVENRNGGGHILNLQPAAGGDQSQIEADVVLVCVGRKPYTDQLGLSDVGVKTDKRGCIEINEKFQTNIPSIRAIGDCVKWSYACS